MRLSVKLKIYLAKNNLSLKRFCEMVNYSRNQIAGVRDGKLRPSRKLALIIEKVTEGEVTADELLKEKEA